MNEMNCKQGLRELTYGRELKGFALRELQTVVCIVELFDTRLLRFARNDLERNELQARLDGVGNAKLRFAFRSPVF